jgi:hypothetical protein
MTEKEAIEVIKTEKKCVLRNMRGCTRDCAHCDLVLPEDDILLAYDMAIRALSHHVVPFGKVTSLDEEDDGK